MRLASLNDRAVILKGAGNGIDVASASGGRFGPGVDGLYGRWDEFRDWEGASAAAPTPLGPGPTGPPSPRPAQVFAIGLNYRDHAAESGADLPAMPATFTKFPTCLVGDDARVPLPSDQVDWEVELVVVVGARAHRVGESDGWRHVAGLTVGQDLSERRVQFAAGAQFSLGKSYAGFGPIGPVLVTPDELGDPDDLAITCSVNGQEMQRSRTSQLVFGVPRLIAELSAIVPLLPGDVIFTGTPAGVGFTRRPPVLLRPGDVITSTIEGIGTLTTHCLASDR